MKQHILTLIAALFFTQGGIAQSSGTFTDARDGQTYKTISFQEASTGKTVTWMAQNLNYKGEGSYAYDDNENNRKVMGLLYTWEAAKKACPNGWHLPTDSEWAMLVNQFGGMDRAGEALKSVKGWSEDGNGTNSSGFNALPGGIRRKGSYHVLGFFGFFWTSSPAGAEGKAWGWNFHYGGPPSSNKQNLTKAFRFDVDVANGVSVRLVRD
ncbi:FISUMP domain-containing protein [Larkinella bovis]|uniref:FISUMP domain-containing protein n=1 Tax=Larkinella bovis TaxID=683041 RepID=A0ABW0I4T8_9BACT